MPFTLHHALAFRQFRPTIVTAGDFATVTCSETGTFRVRFPGPLRIGAKATYLTKIEIDNPTVEEPGGSGGKTFDVQEVDLPLTVRIESPDGAEFTRREVAVQDLARFRDLQGVTRGLWTYRVTGRSPQIAVGDGSSVTSASGSLSIGSDEAIASQSAAPLVGSTITAAGTRRFTFDLHRIGRFAASVRSRAIVTPVNTWRGSLTLKDPDGAIVARSDSDRLTFDVTLPVLDKSRTPSGDVRLWALEVVTLTAAPGGNPITATVITTARLAVSLLNDRIQTLLGQNGSNISVFGENSGGKALVKLRILSELTAETVDMHDLLDGVVEGNPDIEAGVAYTIASTDESQSGGRVIVSGMKVKTITVSIGASRKITPPTPAIRARVTTEGKIKVTFAGASVATAALAGGSLEFEAGLRLDASGSFVPETFFPAKAVDLDLDAAAYAAAVALTGGVGALGAAAFAEAVEAKANELIRDKAQAAVAAMIARTPRILALFNGADFTYTSVRLDEDDILFDYVAPEEPTPKPSRNYTGVMGRAVSQLGPTAIRIIPPDLGDTWARENLTKKIKNIVVVMMENRSFDHVLGYRSQLPGASDDEDGLSQEILTAMAAEMVKAKLATSTDTIPRLGQSSFAIKTQFPVPVGHDAIDVVEQLSARMTLPSKRDVNSPVGFARNFAKRLREPVNKDKAKAIDVLGFYEAADLPFFKFLAENYAYCEKYYCSHPGPTLPNRMFSLAGDLQFNRVGEALIENNDLDDLLLSRASNIYDLLTRKNVGWRVYESFPSVTMLRMFARYAGDDTNIVPISRLDQDITAGLPPLTVIEPAMHHFPQTDDHPVADMCNGQAFLRGIYDRLSRSAQWKNMLLLISYDEHGGFYDHVIPPQADLRSRDSDVVVTAGTTPGASPAAATAGPARLLTPYGVRVPTFVVSPWVHPGPGPGIVLDHCSILKTILACFCGDSQPFLSDRVQSSRSFDAFLTETDPRLNVPPAPQITCAPAVDPDHPPGRIVTPPLFRRQMRSGSIDYHVLTGMLARLLGRK